MVETPAPRPHLSAVENSSAATTGVTKVSRTLTAANVGGKRARKAEPTSFQSLAAQSLKAALLLAVGIGLSAAAPGALAARELSGSEVSIYREAVRAADAGRLSEAAALAARGSNPGAAKLVRWIALTTPGGGTFSEISAFLRENPDWPGVAALKRRAERELVQAGDTGTLLNWFDRNPPVSTDGVTAYAEALIAAGREERAAGLVRAHWTGTSPSPADETAFLARFGRYLRPQEHAARLSRLLWERESAAAQRMTPLLDSNQIALLNARLALQAGRPGADGLADAVGGRAARDPGLLYDLLRYHRQKDNDAAARAVLERAPENLERPTLWWRERQVQVRRLLDQGDARAAYRLAAAHGAAEDEDGLGEADAEFLAGWIALRFLNEPSRGLKHFERLFNNATAPITLARGAYWAGRAEDADGDKSSARRWYEKAAPYGSTYYGQLAAHALGRPHAAVPAEPKPSSSAQSAFERKELVQAARMLAQIAGANDDRTAAFVRRIALDARTPDDLALSARLAQQIGRPDLAIAAAKQAAQLHVYLMETGYPVLAVARTAQPEAALTHAIIRQESTFNTNVVSSAGARGLMQLMPATAKLTAGKLGIKHQRDAQLVNDPAYNVKLGSAYLASQIERFDGSYAMAAAAYNAGPGRVVRWMEMYGDPRTGAVDWVDWVERIPFYETRNYVQRVMEALVVYRQRLGDGPANLHRELTR